MKRPFQYFTRLLRYPFNRTVAFAKVRKFHSCQRSLEELVDRAMDLGTSGFFRVKTWQRRSEILRLAQRVRERDPKIIVEIGTAYGGTLFIWAHCASEAAITCDIAIKPFVIPLYRSFPPPQSRCGIAALTGDTHQAAFKQRLQKTLGGRPIDFLFIDGDHRLAGVTRDFELYAELVRPGGIIAFHDILEKQPFPGNQVYHLWKKINMNFRHEELIDNPDQIGAGIGIIFI
jgi:predicted O-methyltransferase YrrM